MNKVKWEVPLNKCAYVVSVYSLEKDHLYLRDNQRINSKTQTEVELEVAPSWIIMDHLSRYCFPTLDQSRKDGKPTLSHARIGIVCQDYSVRMLSVEERQIFLDMDWPIRVEY